MKYLEELQNGNKFLYNKLCYIISSDYKKSKDDIKRLCINLNNGHIIWLDNDTMVDQIFIFYQNEQNLLVEIKNETNN
jgi:hypothetical protein